MTVDLGCTTSIDIISEHITLKGQTVVDVGCGAMAFSRSLAELGARVLAIDPDLAQAELNRAADPIDSLDFVESGADAIPVLDHSVDGVFFCFSLHHVPASLYPKAFAEVIRVLKPGGYLCVIEPVDGPLNTVMKFFHNEDVVRAEAQQALVQRAVPAFEEHSIFTYHSFIQYDSFDAFAGRYSKRSFNSGYSESDVRHTEVQEAFERLGAPDYRFESPKQMMLLRGVKST